MSEIIKARCKKINQYFTLELNKVGSSYKVINMTLLDDDKAKFVVSKIKQPKFETAENLLPCYKCNSRVIGGCSCAKSKVKCEKGKWDFQCVYCKEFEIDYNLPSQDDIRGMVGKEIVLEQNQTVKISDLCADGEKIEKVAISGGWDEAKFGHARDVDFSVVLANSRDSELVYFGELEDEANSVLHHGDNLTGAGYAQEDDEMIDVDLKKVPSKYDKIFFVINIYRCDDRGQTFNDVKNLYVRMNNKSNGRALLSYNISNNNGRATGLVVAMMSREGNDWTFKAIGDYNKCKSVSELRDYCLRKTW